MRNLIANIKNNKEIAKRYIDRRLFMRLIIFAIVSLILVGVVIFNIASGKINIFYGTGGLGVGLIVGFLAGRMFNIFWHPEDEKVVSRLDAMGIAILILYIIMEIERDWIFGHWMTGPMLPAFSFAVLTGLILGRFLSMVFKIRKIFLEKNILQ